MMNKLVDLNKVIFEGIVYVRVNDLTLLFEGVSTYRIKKVISEMGLETVKLKGFGGSRYIKETDANKLVIDEQTVMLSTKVRTLNNTIRQVKLMNKMFQPGKEIERQLIEDKIQKFIEEEDYVVEEVEEPKAIQENKIFNKKMELENLAYRKVYIGLKTPYSSSGGVNVLINKENNIIGTPIYDDFTVVGDKFYMDNTEEYSGDLEKDYSIKLDLNMGTVEVDEDKVCRELMKLAYNSDFIDDDFGGRIYKNNTRLYKEDIDDLQHKDTMFTGIKY